LLQKFLQIMGKITVIRELRLKTPHIVDYADVLKLIGLVPKRPFQNKPNYCVTKTGRSPIIENLRY